MFDIDRLELMSGRAAEMLAAMANRNRLMILCHLLAREMAVLPLAEAVGMSQSALSQQLSKLRALRLVTTRRDGRTIYYRVASDEAKRILETLHDMYCAPTEMDDAGSAKAYA